MRNSVKIGLGLTGLTILCATIEHYTNPNKYKPIDISDEWEREQIMYEQISKVLENTNNTYNNSTYNKKKKKNNDDDRITPYRLKKAGDFTVSY